MVATVETQDFANYVESTFPSRLAATPLKKYPPVNYASANFVTAGKYGDGYFAKASQFPSSLQ